MTAHQVQLETFAANFPLQEMPGFFNIMTLDSRYVCANDRTLKLVGYDSHDRLIGTHYENLPCKVSESAEIFKEEDKRAIQTGKSLRILSYQCFAEDHWGILLGEKRPIFNQMQEVIGTTAQFIDVTHFNLIDLGRFMKEACAKKHTRFTQRQFSFILLPNDFSFLTPRQIECLFFSLRGYSSKLIARVLSISLRTVHDHIEDLKAKFQCTNKMMLIEKAIAQGFMNYLPETLLYKPLGQNKMKEGLYLTD